MLTIIISIIAFLLGSFMTENYLKSKSNCSINFEQYLFQEKLYNFIDRVCAYIYKNDKQFPKITLPEKYTQEELCTKFNWYNLFKPQKAKLLSKNYKQLKIILSILMHEAEIMKYNNVKCDIKSFCKKNRIRLTPLARGNSQDLSPW